MNMTKRVALVGGLVTTSLVSGVAIASATTEQPSNRTPPPETTAVTESVEMESGKVRMAWLVRPRPAVQRSPTI